MLEAGHPVVGLEPAGAFLGAGLLPYLAVAFPELGVAYPLAGLPVVAFH